MVKQSSTFIIHWVRDLGMVLKSAVPGPLTPTSFSHIGTSLRRTVTGEPASQVPSSTLSLLLSLPAECGKVEAIRFQSASRAALCVLTTSQSSFCLEAEFAQKQTIFSNFVPTGKPFTETETIYKKVYLNSKLDWTDNTEAIYKKGQSRLFLLRRLRSFGVQGALLKTFVDSVVASAIFYGVVCWCDSISTADRRRLDKVIRKANSVLGIPLDTVQETGLRNWECAEQLVDVFTDIFNISLSTAVPTCLKMMTIVPMPKKSTVSCLNDYCPIALTAIVIKCSERLLMRHIKTQLPHSLDPMQFA
ncbi:hypothetical protein C0J45_9251 [Silurus meridionalis]|nr:hypothetical protein C0J45_9251 [Silurus meridionalis]